jgi:curli biogenesis system outer membrane secretion channel CsgG/peptidoglycan hydrolase-like protein with peptidoglycan-binding domain
MKSVFAPILLSASILALAACKTNPQTASIVAQPKSAAVKTVTSFTPALRCMDNLFVQYAKRDIVITSAGIPDHTGQITAGTKDMMISAISKMSIKSKAFRFVDYDPNQLDVFELQRTVIGFTESFQIPNYYIRGAITQLDAGVASDSIGGGISIPALSLGYNQDQIVSVVSMDLNMGNLVTRQIIPGVQATNSLSVTRSGKGGDADGQVGKVGFFFQMSMDRSEGTHAAVRALIELSLIETLGKFTKVPYWRCLQIESTNPLMTETAREWFDSMKPEEKVTLVQRALVGAGYLGGEPTGILDDATQEAVGRYQSENRLIADGRINFGLYYSLLSQNHALPPEKPKDQKKLKTADGGGGISKASVRTEAAKRRPATLALRKPIGKRVYRKGDFIKVDVASREGAFVYCYYQDGKGSVARVFPNRFSPDAYVAPRAKVSLPDANWPFKLTSEGIGVERISCVASRREIGIALPPWLMIGDLEPIKGRTIDSIVNEYRKLDKSGLIVEEVQFPSAAS